MEFNGDVDVDNLGTLPSVHRPYFSSTPTQPRIPGYISGQRDYFTSTSLFDGWSERKTVIGERLHPSAPELYYAIQCNNGTGIGRGDLYMTLYDPKCNAKRQSDSFSNHVTHRPSHVDSSDWIINLKPGWNLVCVQAYTKHKIWFSELQRDAVYSKYPPNSILATQVLWLPVNIFPGTNYIGCSLFELRREAMLSGPNGFLIARTDGVSKVFFHSDSNKKEKVEKSTSPLSQQKVGSVLLPCKKRKRKSKKGHFRSTLVLSTDPLDYKVITIYFNSSKDSPLKAYVAMKLSHVIFPSVIIKKKLTHQHVYFEERKYYVVMSSEVKHVYKGFSKWRILPPEEYQRLLERHHHAFFYMVDVVPKEHPVRFIACTNNEYERLFNKEVVNCFDSQQFKIEVNDTANILLPGITISMWSAPGKCYTKTHTFTVEEIQMIANVYKKGYGDRGRANCNGGCFFSCDEKASVMQNCDPFQVREQLRHTAYYHREYSNLEQRHEVESLLQVAAGSVMTFSKEINSHYVALMDHDTCTRIICTYGLGKQVSKQSVGNNIIFIESKVGEEGSIGFANSPHCDSCDKITKVQQESICTDSTELGHSKYSRMKVYCDRMKNYKGLGLPTTCGYHVRGLDKCGGFALVAKFGIHGFTMDLSHNCVHHFLGWSFDHVTFVPVLVSESNVRIANYRDDQTPPVLILGWGKSGGPPLVDANRRNLVPAANITRCAEVANRLRRRQELERDQEARAARAARRVLLEAIVGERNRRRATQTEGTRDGTCSPQNVTALDSDEDIRKTASTNKRRRIEEETEDEYETTEEEEEEEEEDNSNYNNNGEEEKEEDNSNYNNNGTDGGAACQRIIALLHNTEEYETEEDNTNNNTNGDQRVYC